MYILIKTTVTGFDSVTENVAVANTAVALVPTQHLCAEWDEFENQFRLEVDNVIYVIKPIDYINKEL